MCISKNSNEIAKVKSKCAERLIDRTFFDKINNKYEIKQLVKHFFFTDVFYKKACRLIMQSVEKILKN